MRRAGAEDGPQLFQADASRGEALLFSTTVSNADALAAHIRVRKWATRLDIPEVADEFPKFFPLPAPVSHWYSPCSSSRRRTMSERKQLNIVMLSGGRRSSV